MKMPFSILSPEDSSTADIVTRIKEELDLLFDILAQQEEDLREAKIMLNRANTEVILYGKQPPPDHTANLGALSDSELFMVAALDLPDRSQLFGSSGTQFQQREVELMKTAVYHVFETTLGPLCIASCCESDVCFANILISLLDEESPEEEITAGIGRALDSAAAIVEQNYGIRLISACSPIIHGYAGLPRARIAVNRALTQSLDIPRIANTEIVPPPEAVIQETFPQSDPRLEKQYYQFILRRDLDMAKLTLKELTTSDLQSPEIPFQTAKLRFLNHVESLIDISNVPRSDVSFLYLRHLATPESVLALLNDVFDALIAGRRQNPEQMQREKLEQVAAYIRENYADCSLCLAKLCDLFNMNQSYLSRTFKSIYSIGILDYIHSRRLIRVKELLRDPSRSIDSIWLETGYTNRRTFNRTFRKFEGMSASDYRRSLLQQGK